MLESGRPQTSVVGVDGGVVRSIGVDDAVGGGNGDGDVAVLYKHTDEHRQSAHHHDLKTSSSSLSSSSLPGSGKYKC